MHKQESTGRQGYGEVTKRWLKECGWRIELRRREVGIPRYALAAAAGLSAPTITRLEQGKINPLHGVKIAVALALDCDIDDLWPNPSRAELLALIEANEAAA